MPSLTFLQACHGRGRVRELISSPTANSNRTVKTRQRKKNRREQLSKTSPHRARLARRRLRAWPKNPGAGLSSGTLRMPTLGPTTPNTLFSGESPESSGAAVSPCDPIGHTGSRPRASSCKFISSRYAWSNYVTWGFSVCLSAIVPCAFFFFVFFKELQFYS